MVCLKEEIMFEALADYLNMATGSSAFKKVFIDYHTSVKKYGYNGSNPSVLKPLIHEKVAPVIQAMQLHKKGRNVAIGISFRKSIPEIFLFEGEFINLVISRNKYDVSIGNLKSPEFFNYIKSVLENPFGQVDTKITVMNSEIYCKMFATSAYNSDIFIKDGGTFAGKLFRKSMLTIAKNRFKAGMFFVEKGCFISNYYYNTKKVERNILNLRDLMKYL